MALAEADTREISHFTNPLQELAYRYASIDSLTYTPINHPAPADERLIGPLIDAIPDGFHHAFEGIYPVLVNGQAVPINPWRPSSLEQLSDLMVDMGKGKKVKLAPYAWLNTIFSEAAFEVGLTEEFMNMNIAGSKEAMRLTGGIPTHSNLPLFTLADPELRERILAERGNVKLEVLEAHPIPEVPSDFFRRLGTTIIDDYPDPLMRRKPEDPNFSPYNLMVVRRHMDILARQTGNEHRVDIVKIEPGAIWPHSGKPDELHPALLRTVSEIVEIGNPREIIVEGVAERSDLEVVRSVGRERRFKGVNFFVQSRRIKPGIPLEDAASDRIGLDTVASRFMHVAI